MIEDNGMWEASKTQTDGRDATQQKTDMCSRVLGDGCSHTRITYLFPEAYSDEGDE